MSDDAARSFDDYLEGAAENGQPHHLVDVAKLLAADAEQMPVPSPERAREMRLRVLEGIVDHEIRRAGRARRSRRSGGWQRRVMAHAMMALLVCGSTAAVAGTDTPAGEAVRTAAKKLNVPVPQPEAPPVSDNKQGKEPGGKNADGPAKLETDFAEQAEVFKKQQAQMQLAQARQRKLLERKRQQRRTRMLEQRRRLMQERRQDAMLNPGDGEGEFDGPREAEGDMPPPDGQYPKQPSDGGYQPPPEGDAPAPQPIAPKPGESLSQPASQPQPPAPQ